jgi:hypothetical protein
LIYSIGHSFDDTEWDEHSLKIVLKNRI